MMPGQMAIYCIAAFSGGLIAGILAMWMWGQIRIQREKADAAGRLSALETERDALGLRIGEYKQSLQQSREENRQLAVQLARIETARGADAEKINWIEKAESGMRETFEALAARTLQKNTDQFSRNTQDHMESLLGQMRGDWKTHRAELNHLVEPVRQNLSALDSQIRDLEQKREGAYQGLSGQLQQLSRAHAEMQSVTITLAQALKSPVTRGQWGEIQLRRVVEMAGMMSHITFAEQAAAGEGRPDMVVKLPGRGMLPIDAKVPLSAYLDASETTDKTRRRKKLEHHARLVKERVRELAGKAYWRQFEKAPEFVVMFVPNDACLHAAFEADPSLFEYAIERQVLIATPVTLIALLKTVAYGWKQQQLTENARHIVEEGKMLYRRLNLFVSHLAEVGQLLSKTVDGFNRSIGSLERRLMPSVRRFEEMGLAEDAVADIGWIDRMPRTPPKDHSFLKTEE